MFESICLTMNCFTDTCCQWEPAQRQRTKVERSLQTSLTQTAKSWSRCLRQAVCEWALNGPKGTGRKLRRHLGEKQTYSKTKVETRPLSLILYSNMVALYVSFRSTAQIIMRLLFFNFSVKSILN